MMAGVLVLGWLALLYLMGYLLRFLLLVMSGLPGLASLGTHKEETPASQMTVVRGTVRHATTGQLLPGVLLGIEAYSLGYFGKLGPEFTGDSTRTDAQGQYELRFRAEPGHSYLVRLEPAVGRNRVWPSGYVFQTNRGVVGPDQRPDSREVLEGIVTTVDFSPDYARPLNPNFLPAGR